MPCGETKGRLGKLCSADFLCPESVFHERTEGSPIINELFQAANHLNVVPPKCTYDQVDAYGSRPSTRPQPRTQRTSWNGGERRRSHRNESEQRHIDQVIVIYFVPNAHQR